MSALAPARAVPAPARRPARTSAAPASAQPVTRPRLVVVPKPTAGRVPFVLAVAGVLAIGLVALLMLHTLAAQDGFTVHKLQRQSAALADQEQALTIANEQAQAPSSLADRAAGLGMVPATSLTITRLHGRPAALLSAPPAPPPLPVVLPAPAPVKPAASGTSTATSKTGAKVKPKPTPTPTATKRP
ncbi:MAG: hypothetical protein QOC82_341 [Frankiaceae bacterium]|nr:hypothetical protein [Frankiaceae bacterium]